MGDATYNHVYGNATTGDITRAIKSGHPLPYATGQHDSSVQDGPHMGAHFNCHTNACVGVPCAKASFFWGSAAAAAPAGSEPAFSSAKPAAACAPPSQAGPAYPLSRQQQVQLSTPPPAEMTIRLLEDDIPMDWGHFPGHMAAENIGKQVVAHLLKDSVVINIAFVI